MVKRSTVTKFYDKLQRTGVQVCWAVSIVGGVAILSRVCEILWFPKPYRIENEPEYKKFIAAKQEMENEELLHDD